MVQPVFDFDVIVIGGGPSGASCAAMIAQAGYRVKLFEREQFPRFHIGESMIPFTYGALERIGFVPEMRESHFVKKYGVQFINEQGKLSEPFRFGDYDPHPRSQTWQIRRSEFDEMLFNHARKLGVDATQNARVMNVLFEGDRAVGVKVRVGDLPEQEYRAKVVVDACGQSSLIIDRLNLREWDADLKKAAVWNYFKGAKREPGLDAGGTIVIQTEGKKGWFWYIPLHDDIVSVGVVAGFDYLFKDRASRDLETIFWEEVNRCPGVKPRLEGSVPVEDYRAQKEYSYASKQLAGNGWVLIGDAAGFLDPLYSSGLLMAVVSAERAADAIIAALASDDTSESKLRVWEKEYKKAVKRMRNLVIAFYEGLNFGKLVRRHPDKKHLITDILIGNLFKDEVDELWPLIDELRAEESLMEV